MVSLIKPYPSPCFLLFLFSLCLYSHLSSAASFLSANQSLSGSHKLTSEGGNFVLGFFKPGNSSFYYIGIWYNKISKLTPVWVANRANPITDPNTSELKISTDGNLVLSNQSQSQVWSTNTTIKSNSSTVATILDSGNLVLSDGSDPNKIYWQSFDHPTNTWLPGAKVGLNKITGETQHLTSWKNSDDPSPGLFSLELDPQGTSQYFLLWNNSHQYWTSGPWNGQIFTLVPEMTRNYIYDFQYVSNATENYFTYSVRDKSIISRFIMDVSGQVQQLTWLEANQNWNLFWSQPKAQCDVYALCGPFGSCNEIALPVCNCIRGFSEKSPSDWDLSDRTEGCVRNTLLQCGENSSAHGGQDRFFPMSNVGLPANAQSLQVGSTSDCELDCLKNCSCTAYSYDNGSCSVWYGDLLNLQDQSGTDKGMLYLRLAASELPSSKSNNGIVIGAVVGGVLVFLALLLIVWLLIWRRRRIGRMMGKAKVVEGGLMAFRYSDLQRATKNFAEKLGGGGFGTVFKGILPDSTAIAVKKLEGFQQGEKQFRTEVSTIGTIQHVNLVRLRGFCSEGNKKLLVYDYMPKGSLDTQLFQSSTNEVLDWKSRYQIALGTARGLVYLHEKCRDCIIHCDIKPDNILLDASFVPKVADFGLAKLMGRDFSRVLTTMRGTRGYLAPEWISGVAITAKADVYSYGMMMFEIISGRRNSDGSAEGKTGFFPTVVVNKLIEGDVSGLLDRRLEGDANLEEVRRACKVACWCIQDDENSRPSMGQVIQILEGILEVNMPPIPRAIQILDDSQGNIVFFSDSSSNQTSHGQRSTTSQGISMSSKSSKE